PEGGVLTPEKRRAATEVEIAHGKSWRALEERSGESLALECLTRERDCVGAGEGGERRGVEWTLEIVVVEREESGEDERVVEERELARRENNYGGELRAVAVEEGGDGGDKCREREATGAEEAMQSPEV